MVFLLRTPAQCRLLDFENRIFGKKGQKPKLAKVLLHAIHFRDSGRGKLRPPAPPTSA